jgi:hypothetical protein
MKSTIPILIILISVLSCNNSKPKKKLTEKEKQEQRAKDELSDYSEKIVLLSAIKKIAYDSLSLILIDYYSITSEYTNSSDSSKFYSEKAINDISGKYHISKSKAASLIFSFKYELLTKEEIADEEIEKREVEQQELLEDSY